jgi:hypothetical protein
MTKKANTEKLNELGRKYGLTITCEDEDYTDPDTNAQYHACSYFHWRPLKTCIGASHRESAQQSAREAAARRAFARLIADGYVP